MVALDESRNGSSFHSDDHGNGSQTKADLDDDTSVKTDINNEHFGEQSKKTNVEEPDLVIEENVVPDGGWGWFIILGCFVIRMICGKGIFIYILKKY